MTKHREAIGMRKFLSAACGFIFIVAGCSPAARIAPTATAFTRAGLPTRAPTAVVENPPACWEADLIYHTQSQLRLLLNCVADPSKEAPRIIWGWNGTH